MSPTTNETLDLGVIAASSRMGAAAKALHEYVERPSDVDANPALHRRLIDDLREAISEFLRVTQ
jgi:hypothetical protein